MRKKRIWMAIGLIGCMLIMAACGGSSKSEKEFLGTWVGEDMGAGEEFQMDIKEEHTIVFTYNGEESKEYTWGYESGKIGFKEDNLIFSSEFIEDGRQYVSFVITTDDGGKDLEAFSCIKSE